MFNEKHYLENFKAEIDLLRTLDHPNVIELYDVYESPDKLMLVMEMCSGGELFDRIADRASSGRGYSEHLAAMILQQVLRAVGFMHSQNICHCDLKPSNILFDSKSEHAKVKVIDFGFAQRVPKWKRYLHKYCGTAFYTAPEVLYGKYNKEGDIWSIGIIMFMMFFGYTPFQRPGEESLSTSRMNLFVQSRILQGFKGIPRSSGRISTAASGLIHRLLKMNVAERYTADQALLHPWFDSASQDDEIPDTVIQKLRKVSVMDNFKVFVLSAFRDDKDLSSTAQLKKHFEKFDTNGDKQISLQEFKDGLSKAQPGLPDRHVREIFDNLDIDGDNYIQFDEFCTAIAYQQLISAYERLALIFDWLDKNRNGYLDRGDIPGLMRAMNGDPLIRRLAINIEDLIKTADLDSDGRVSFHEFLFAMHPELVEPNQREWFKSQVATKRSSLHQMILKEQEVDIQHKNGRYRPLHSQTETSSLGHVEAFDDKKLEQSSFDHILTKIWSIKKLPDASESKQNQVLTKLKDRIQEKEGLEEEVKNYQGSKIPVSHCNSLVLTETKEEVDSQSNHS